MVTVDRRRFLTIAGGATAATMLNQSIARAAAIPANRATGSLQDVEHIVVLMQENRSFEHYLGSLRGVRGFGDPHPATLPNGKSVWHQSDGGKDLLPFHPDVNPLNFPPPIPGTPYDDLGAAFLEGLPHSWTDAQAAINQGVYDTWVPAKGTTTMAYLKREDLGFHYALADAFTVCDAYHCSFIGGTDPNRYYMWTGWTGNDGKLGGPVLYNDEVGYDWMTYPERLEAAGVSWKVYQDIGDGLDAAGSWGWTNDAYIGNYGDNSLLYFNTYRNAQPGSALYEKARTGTNAKGGDDFFSILKNDVVNGTLPSISWIAAPEAFSEHPNFPANYGAWYLSQVLDALTANPEVWSKTALLVTYDENDGFFDHIVPPQAPNAQVQGASTVPTTNEYYSGAKGDGPFGMGARVPMFVVSPWSTGGWVCSETFDHTSIVRLMEKRFGVLEPQITPWRRAVAGDLTAAFNFAKTVDQVPAMPDTSAWKPLDDQRRPSYSPTPPAAGEMPKQEPGLRHARPLGYDLTAREGMPPSTGRRALRINLANEGWLGAHFWVRQIVPSMAPLTYTVGAGDSLTASIPISGDYDVQLHGPNGFFRRYVGHQTKDRAWAAMSREGRTLQLLVTAPSGVNVVVRDAYRGDLPLVDGVATLDTSGANGWYDVVVSINGKKWRRTFAGHLENGQPSTSDPALGR